MQFGAILSILLQNPIRTVYALSVLLKLQFFFLHSQNVSNDLDVENLADAVLQLHLREPDTYQPSSQL